MTIGKTSDLLACKPLVEVIRHEGLKEQAIDKVMAAILKCSSALGVEMKPDQISTLATDIFDVYKYDSLEDITHCLKQGRQGAYSDIPMYGKFNMIIFQQWMARHLDKKYEAKEKQIETAKQEEKEELSRDEFYERGMKLREELQKIEDSKSISEKNFFKEKVKYFAGRVEKPEGFDKDKIK